MFIDFNKLESGQISIIRISFDGYGCCSLNEKAKTLNTKDSELFIDQMNIEPIDQNTITELVKKAIRINQEQIWTDALEKYELIEKE